MEENKNKKQEEKTKTDIAQKKVRKCSDRTSRGIRIRGTCSLNTHNKEAVHIQYILNLVRIT